MSQIIDQYDDVDRHILSQLLDGDANLQKMASSVTASKDPRRIPDHRWAVVMTKEGHVSRKYPLNNGENTVLSAMYFMKTSQKLPKTARAMAAKSIKEAMESYGLEVPEVMSSLARPMRGVEGNRVDVTHDKVAEITLPAQRPSSLNDYALVKEGSGYYPISNYGEMLDAVEYFREFERDFDPIDRREFCTKLASRIPEAHTLPERMLDYASPHKSLDSIGHGLTERSAYLTHDHPMQAVLQKVASIMNDASGEDLVRILYNLDKKAGLDRYWDIKNGIDNPVRTVFRHVKQAEKVLWDGKNDRLTETQLKSYCGTSNARSTLKNMLGSSGSDEFIKNPVEVYKSLPDDLKEMIARLASDNTIDGDPAAH